MDLYRQDAEVRLLQNLLPHLRHTSAIDVGAEHGSFASALLAAGSDRVDVIEPEPENVQFLQQRFAGDARVFVHQYAVTDEDGPVKLYKSVAPSGEQLSFGHT